MNGIFQSTTYRSCPLSGNLRCPRGLFDNLGKLQTLWLYSNSISELPSGIFDGLNNLRNLLLGDNPGSKFTFTAELEKQGDVAVAVKVVEGAPYPMTVSLSAVGGTLSTETVTVRTGNLLSDPVTVTPDSDEESDQVTVSVSSAAFPVHTSSPHIRYGVRTARGESLTLTFGAANSPATGLPVITGTAQVDETLTADTSGIDDPDGIDSATTLD